MLANSTYLWSCYRSTSVVSVDEELICSARALQYMSELPKADDGYVRQGCARIYQNIQDKSSCLWSSRIARSFYHDL